MAQTSRDIDLPTSTAALCRADKGRGLPPWKVVERTSWTPSPCTAWLAADLKTADGSSISLDRNGDATGRDVIKTGDVAAFNIYFPVNNSGGSGIRPTKIVVTPPNETKSVTVSWPAGSLPATDHPDGTKLEISPVRRVG
ncbi:DUF4232 domain-containing protein [Streptomyces sp. NPDC032161]|uniref:DUF4232 domain-containing protein n=1 Tax=unclassified Streptomyces TaxID=2593676 RepID=UPI0033C0B4C6